MGLDMYLTAENYISGYRHAPLRDEVVGVFKGNHPPMRGEGHASVELHVAYWRKANAIHGWFVREVMGGNDDCEKHFVPVQELRRLVALCEHLLIARDGDEAAELLPTESGFFFGSTDYDDWYWEGLTETVDQLKPLVDWFDSDSSNQHVWDVFYRASW